MAKKRQINFGIIGCGGISVSHESGIMEAPSARLVATMDIIPERAKAMAEKHNCRWYGDLKEMLKDPELEAVCICTPSGLHAEPGIAAARAGKHILVEKPMDKSLAKAKQLVATCRRKGVKLGCVFQTRLTPAARQVKAAIDKGLMGQLITGIADTLWFRAPEYYASGEWRGTLALDGGAFWNQGVHYVDLLCWLMGDIKKVLCASLKTMVHKIESEDAGVAMFEFRNGAIGVIRATTDTNPALPARVEICGTKGSAVIQSGKLVHFAIDGKVITEEQANFVEDGPGSNPLAFSFQGHTGHVEDLCQAIIKNREPYINGEEGLRAVKLLTEVYEVSGIESKAKGKGKKQ